MTDPVRCRVCGCSSPLGTVECPDCGAPLPRELPREPEPRMTTPEVAEETASPAETKQEASPKRRLLRWASVFVAVCLAAELALALWPQKPAPPGVYWGDGCVVTPEGVWNYEAEGFYPVNATSDGRYVLLRGPEDMDDPSRTREKKLWVSGMSMMSYTYAPEGDYYLFDGRTLEHTDWTRAVFTDAGTVFYTYTREEETGPELGWRDLNTGKDHKLQTRGEGTELETWLPSADGAALAYRWAAADGEEPGPYFLWRAKDRKAITLDAPGSLMGVGNRGESCLFWVVDEERERYRGNVGYSYHFWHDGEVRDLPDGMAVAWVSADFTQMLLREQRENYDGDWYYFDVDAMTEPRKLDVPSDCYLSSMGLYQSYQFETLTEHFYITYEAGRNKIYYLTHKGELILAVEGLDGDFVLDAAGKNAVYLKNGDLYRLSVHPDDTLETVQLTRTVGDVLSSVLDSGSVTAFAANQDLSHIYYQARSEETYIRKGLYHWHDGESHTLDFEINHNYGNVPMAVTEDGGCYFTYARDLYFTEKDAPPALLLEEVGMNAAPQLVGEKKWPLLPGTVWVDGEKEDRFWLLDGGNEPIELTEWYPKEGTV